MGSLADQLRALAARMDETYRPLDARKLMDLAEKVEAVERASSPVSDGPEGRPWEPDGDATP